MRLFSILGVMPGNQNVISQAIGRVTEGVKLEDIADLDQLHKAWKKVRRNKGAAGRDGITLQAYEASLDKNLNSLSKVLLRQTYRPKRLRRTSTPKAGGGRRKLSIPCIADRVAQTAALLALGPTLEPKMSAVSWAYRAGRGVADAVGQVQTGFARNLHWTVDADISKYFDTVPHSRLIDETTIWIDDERVIRLFGLWWKGFSKTGRGIAQRSPISPLLANLYLHPVDRLLVSSCYRIVRDLRPENSSNL